MTKTLAFIGARGGSKRLKQKNLRTINGKTLIEITMRQAIASDLIDKIVFSSEDQEIIEEAKRVINKIKNSKIDISCRNPELSKDEIDIIEVVKETCKNYEDYDLIVILQVDHPFKTSSMIDKCIKIYKNNLIVDDVITYKNNQRTGSIRIISRKTLYSNLITGHIYLVEENPNFIDIHTNEDLEKAREEIPKCLICGSGDVVRFEFEEQLWKCNDCGVVFQYPQNHFDYGNYKESRVAGRDKRIKQYKLDISEILRYKNYGKFLDVGCGRGTFLELLPNSFERYGIDIRDTKYYKGDFLTFNFNKKFDVIQMRATLEHVKNPRRFIKRSYELLKENGLLVISHLPNIDNYPKMKHLIKPDEHLFYFNSSSITELLEDEGFEIFSINFPYFKTPYQFHENAKFMNVMNIYSEKDD